MGALRCSCEKTEMQVCSSMAGGECGAAGLCRTKLHKGTAENARRPQVGRYVQEWGRQIHSGAGHRARWSERIYYKGERYRAQGAGGTCMRRANTSTDLRRSKASSTARLAATAGCPGGTGRHGRGPQGPGSALLLRQI